MQDEQAILQYYVPGVLISIQIPFKRADGTGLNNFLNIKKEFNNFAKTFELEEIPNVSADKESQVVAVSTNSLDATVLNTLDSQKVKPPTKPIKKVQLQPVSQLDSMKSLTMAIGQNQKRNSRMDDIIEKMERKYTTLHTSNPINSTFEYDDDSDSDSDVDVQIPVTESTGTIVDAPPKRKAKNKRKRNSEQDYYDLDDDFIDDSENFEIIETMVKMKCKTKQDGFFVSSGEIEVIEESIDDEESSSDSESDISNNESESDQENSQYIVRKKPEWSPNETVLAAIERFKDSVAQLNMKPLPKSALIPSIVHEPLFLLDTVLHEHYPLTNVSNENSYEFITTKLSGYHETIANCFGPQYPVGKVKKLIKQLEFKKKSINLKLELDANVQKLKDLIRSNIIEAPPVNPNVQTTEEVSSSSSSIEIAVESNIENPKIDEKITTTNEVVVDIPDIQEELNPSSSSFIEDTAGKKDDVTKTTDKPLKPKPKKAPGPVVVYKWKCRWTITMKTLLITIEDLLNKWIEVENKFRATLTQLEMRDMDDDDCEDLERKDVTNDVFGDIVSVCPPECMNSDLSSLRRLISGERSRLKKNEALKLAKATASMNSNTSTNSGDGANSTEPPILTSENSGVKPKTKRQITSVPDSISNGVLTNDPGKSKLISTSVSNSINATQESNVDAPESQSLSNPQHRKPTAKPAWTPNQDVLDEFEAFAKALAAKHVIIPLPKSSPIPSVIDSDLLNLHEKVLEIYPSKRNSRGTIISFVNTTTGYFEAITSILGGLIPSRRVRNRIQLLVAEKAASTAKEELDHELSRFEEYLPYRITPFHTDEEVELDSDSAKPQDSDVTQDPSVKYSWKCLWNVELRNILFSIDSKIAEWVQAENNYRKLKPDASKTSDDKVETDEIAYKDVSLNILNKLSSTFPDNCARADVSTLRKQISLVRAKLKKQNQPPEKSKPSENTKAPLSSSTQPPKPLASSIPFSSIIGSPSSELIITPDVLNKSPPVVRVVKEKPQWQPNQDCLDAIEEFKKFVVNSQIKPLSKSAFIPHILDDELFKLYSTVIAKYSTSLKSSSPQAISVTISDPVFLSKTVGFYETIVAILGGNIPVGRVKNAIHQILLRVQNEKNILKRNNSIDLFKDLLRSNIEDGEFTIDSLNDQIDVSAHSKGHENSMDEAIVSVNKITTYKKKCNWSFELRAALLAVENATIDWVKSENLFRATLTVADMKDDPSLEDTELKEKEELADTMKSLVSNFPEECLYGDLPSLKHYLSLERRRARVQNNQRRSLPASSVTSSKPSSSSNTIQTLPPKPIQPLNMPKPFISSTKIATIDKVPLPARAKSAPAVKPKQPLPNTEQQLIKKRKSPFDIVEESAALVDPSSQGVTIQSPSKEERSSQNKDKGSLDITEHQISLSPATEELGSKRRRTLSDKMLSFIQDSFSKPVRSQTSKKSSIKTSKRDQTSQDSVTISNADRVIDNPAHEDGESIGDVIESRYEGESQVEEASVSDVMKTESSQDESN